MNRFLVLVIVSVAMGSHLSGALAAGQRREGQAQPFSPAVSFLNIARAAGVDFVHVNGASPEKYLVETMGSGGLFLDFDNDGWLDIFLVDGGSLADSTVASHARHRLYRNLGNGRFEDVTSRSGIVHREYGMGACAADYDNDGRIDLFVTNFGANTLYHNNGNGTFTDVTREAHVGSPLWSTSCAFADFDKDGYLDLNDNDGWPDIFVANDSVPNFLFQVADHDAKSVSAVVGDPDARKDV